MKLKEYLKEISIKKLFITILCSIIITTSLSFTIVFIESLSGILVNEALSTWNDKMPDEVIEYGKKVEETINKKVQEEKDMYGSDYPSEGILFYRAMSNSRENAIVETYKQSILVGIILGTFVYIVWVQKAKKKNLLIESVICGGMMLILVVLVNVIYELVFYVMMKNLGQEAYIYSLNDVYDIKNVAIICVGIFAVVYVGNYIYQRIMVSRLNKELNK